jgi:type IV secretion system protein VirD4
MRLLRRLLIGSVLLLVYTAVVITILWPWAGAGMAIVALAALARKTVAYSAMGTARWADATDVPHLLEGFGLVLGYLAGKPSKWRGVMGLFNRRLPTKQAVQRLLMACQRKPPKNLVRLTSSINTMVVAPVGAGKGVSCVIPWLLTNPDSAVVVDFKGELTLASALQREKEFGHKIVILDPFKVVTQ